jgi:RNA polymerase sigma-70 factor (ECF subfamily)
MAEPPATRPSLLVRVRDAQDRDAWQQFIDLYGGVVYGFLRKRGLQDADAADVAQDVLQRVAGAVGRLEYDSSRGTFRAWLFTLTRNQLSKFLSAPQRRVLGTGDSATHVLLDAQPDRGRDPEALWEEEYRRCLLARAAERVRGHFAVPTWQAFWQTAVEGKTAAEAAAALGLSVGAVYVARSRVSARMQEQLRRLEAEGPGGQR